MLAFLFVLPTVRDGDSLVLRRICDGEPRQGDIVAFLGRGGRRVLLHRGVEVHSTYVVTRGDALAGSDGSTGTR